MNEIKKYREQAKLTQSQLGEMIGVGQGAIGHYESGRREPGLEECRSIVSALADAGAVTDTGEPVGLDDVFPPSDETQQTERKTA